MTEQDPGNRQSQMLDIDALELPLGVRVASLLILFEEEPFSTSQMARRLLATEVANLAALPEPEAQYGQKLLHRRIGGALKAKDMHRTLQEEGLGLQYGQLQQDVPEKGLCFHMPLYRAIAFEPSARKGLELPYRITWGQLPPLSSAADVKVTIPPKQPDPFFRDGEPLVDINKMFEDVSFEGWSRPEALSRVLSKRIGRPYTIKELANFVNSKGIAPSRQVSDPERASSLAAVQNRVISILRAPSFQQSLMGRDNVLQAGKIQKLHGRRVNAIKAYRALSKNEIAPIGTFACGPYEIDWEGLEVPYRPRLRGHL